MHIEHMKEAREFIAALPPKACDMTDFYQIAMVEDSDDEFITFSVMKEHGFACGSAACFAGWTAMMAEQKTPHEMDFVGSIQSYAQAYLGLTYEEGERLFIGFPDNTPDDGWQEWMVARLDDCIELGYVPSWNYDADDDDDDPYEEDDEDSPT